MSRIISLLLISSLFVPSAGAADLSKEFSFTLTIPEVLTASFHSVSGLESETEVIEYRDGAASDVARKVPGVRKVGDITLKRGVTRDKKLWLWKQALDADHTGGVNGLLVMHDRQGNQVAQWNLFNAWPKKVSVEADAVNDIAIETLTLTVERIDRP